MAYYRRVKADFLAAADPGRVGAPAYPPANTYPEPVEHCDVCRWWAVCRDRRRADDDLSLVAGISGRQRRGLKERRAGRASGQDRHAARAGRARARRRSRSSTGAAARPSSACASRPGSRSRARIAARSSGSCWSRSGRPDAATGARTLVPDRGFLVLPEPSPNDLFLDLEGDPFAFDDGVDYLFGVLDPSREAGGRARAARRPGRRRPTPAEPAGARPPVPRLLEPRRGRAA